MSNEAQVNAAAVVQTMQALEETLLHADHSRDPAALERLLAPDFTEVNGVGGDTSRSEVVRWLLQKDPAARWQFSALDVVELAPSLRLVRYHAQQIAPPRAAPSKGARHVSLWCFNAALQCWQLRFHQATKVL
jgi:hypothetical protein